jgi:hypothetical protein
MEVPEADPVDHEQYERSSHPKRMRPIKNDLSAVSNHVRRGPEQVRQRQREHERYKGDDVVERPH